jgi:hypothetical protein
MVKLARLKRKRRMRMPFAQVVESGEVVASCVEESAQGAQDCSYRAHERSPGATMTLNGQVPQTVDGICDVLAHHNATDFLIPSILQGDRDSSLDLVRN